MNIKYIEKYLLNIKKDLINKNVVLIADRKDKNILINLLIKNIHCKNVKYIEKCSFEQINCNLKSQKYVILLDYKNTLKIRNKFIENGLKYRIDFFNLYEEIYIVTTELRNSQADFLLDLTNKVDLSNKVILEIGCGSGLLAKTIAKVYSPKKIIGTDIQKWNGKLNEFILEDSSNNLKFVMQNGKKLNFSNMFDVIYTISTFEHINDIDGVLESVQSMLKINGYFYTYFGPLWSSYVGHHYQYWVEKYKNLIPNWGHLYMSKEELFNYLVEQKKEDFFQEIYYVTYISDYINRKTRKDFYEIIYNSNMQVLEIQDEIKFPPDTSREEILKLMEREKKVLGDFCLVDLLTYRMRVLLKKI